MALVNVAIKGQLFSHEVSGPYVFKSGKKAGQSVESLMFSDYGYLAYLKRIADKEMVSGSKPNKLHLRLAWVMRVGEFVKSPENCPYCYDKKAEGGYKKVEMFSVRYSYGSSSFGLRFTCCNEDECKYKLLEEKSKLLPLKFSSMAYFSNAEQKRLGAFFKDLLLGPGRLDAQKAFEMFFSAIQF